MIVMDLEWNSGRYGGRLNEVLQIGAVKLDHLGGRVLDSFCAYIRPRVHKTYSPAAAVLPELSLALESRNSFPEVMDRFRLWWGGDREFAIWGTADLLVLAENLAYWSMPNCLPDHFYDLQAAFAEATGSANSPALEPAVDYCRIPETFEFHNALYDALYTALVGASLTPEEVNAARRVPGEPTHRERTVTRLGLPVRKTGLWLGPYSSLEAALNSRASRLGECPQCGKPQRTSTWYSDDGQYFFSRLKCPTHGDYILRLETAWDKRRRLWTFPEVGKTTPGNETLLEMAMAGDTFSCQSLHTSGHSRHRRRRRRSESSQEGKSSPS